MATAKDIQNAFYHHTYQRYEILAPNIFLDWQFNEMDLLGLRRSGFVDEIEIKLSRSDFLADFKKTVSFERKTDECSYPDYYDEPKHDAVREGLAHCNYYSFLMPEELAEKCEIPEYSGLYVYRVNNAGIGRVHEVKTAPRLHKRKLSERLKYEVGRKMAFRYWNIVTNNPL